MAITTMIIWQRRTDDYDCRLYSQEERSMFGKISEQYHKFTIIKLFFEHQF